MSLPAYFEAVENHLNEFFEDDEILVFDEIKSPDFHLDVYWIKPNRHRKYHILLTNGISSNPMNTPPNYNPYIELAILLPENWKLSGEHWKEEKYYWPIYLLKSTGRFPSENDTWLGFGHTILEENEEPLLGTNFISTILLKSKTLPEEFQSISFKDQTIDVFLLFPIYKEEYEFKKANGTNALLDRFQESNIDDIVNPKRKNVCL